MTTTLATPPIPSRPLDASRLAWRLTLIIETLESRYASEAVRTRVATKSLRTILDELRCSADPETATDDLRDGLAVVVGGERTEAYDTVDARLSLGL